MKIYTRKGDKGKTSLARGTIVDKDDLRVEAYGTIDELNSYLGLLSSMVDDLSLVDIQRKLFLIGGFLSDEKAKSLILDSSCVLELENEIDKYSEDLEEVKIKQEKMSVSLHMNILKRMITFLQLKMKLMNQVKIRQSIS